MATLSAITGTLRDLTGAVLPITSITFTRDGVSGQDGATIIPRAIVAISDAVGAIAVTLYSGNYSAQTIGADGGLITFAVAVPAAASAVLSNLINAASIVYTPAAQSASEAAAAAALVSEQAAAASAATIGSAMLSGNNLSDVASAATARANLGLGSAATTAATAYATVAQGVTADSALQSMPVSTTTAIGAVETATTAEAQAGAAAGKYPDVVGVAAAIAAQATSPVKAWVSFNGAGVVAINASLNVSSITDLGVGTYRLNFTTALAHANYAVAGNGNSYSPTDPGGQNMNIRANSSTGTPYYKTASGVDVLFGGSGSSLRDVGELDVQICG